jgi:mono/diheme cytochrome c family protein
MFATFWFFLVGLSPLLAADSNSPPQFERDILPLFTQYCLKCHGLEGRMAGLDLRTPDLVLRGGDNGPAIVKGSVEESLLFKRISSGTMPPGDEKKLSPEQVEVVRRWIVAGGPATGSYGPITQAEASAATAKDRQFWAFQKPVPSGPPRVRQSSRVRTPIDAFLLARLEAKKLEFAPEADRIALARRAWFDLIGLPPSPEEAAEFQADLSPQAWEGLVDRLLASPHFGERWGRHWLDAAGYVDAQGLDHLITDDKTAEGKYLYRDYVIRAFNGDMPYDRFVTEQLAGDELVDWRSAQKFDQEIRNALTATGFLRTAADDTDIPEVNTADIRYTVLHQTLQVVTSNLLGLTVGCAKCHTHKYDPIPQQDYYRLMSIFTPAYNVQSWLQPKERALADVSASEKEEIDRHNAEVEKRLEPFRTELEALLRPYRERLLDEKLSRLPEPVRADIKSALETPEKRRTPVEKYLVTKLGPLVEIKPADVRAALSADDREKAQKVEERMAPLTAELHSYGKIQALYDVTAPPPTYLLRRGNFETPGPEVEPGFLSVLGEPGERILFPALDPVRKASGRRLAFARWLTHPNSAAGGLVARVMVNRIWLHLFGEGIVTTPDNFGNAGARPTHPELLDWLATEFMNSGWRIKPLIKLIMTSSAYRQASYRKDEDRAVKIDPGNQLLWHMRIRRLESEMIRDSILATSGKLNRSIGGPSVRLEYQPDGMVIVSKEQLRDSTDQWRRSLYMFTRRNYNLTMLSTFDHPVMSTNCVRRVSSSVVPQSLTLLNDRFVMDQADEFADRLAKAAGPQPDKTVELAYRIAFARKPTHDEKTSSLELMKRHTERYGASNLSAEQASQKALANLCRMLWNANEFLYVQ